MAFYPSLDDPFYTDPEAYKTPYAPPLPEDPKTAMTMPDRTSQPAADDWFATNAPTPTPAYVQPGAAPQIGEIPQYQAPQWSGGDFQGPQRPDVLKQPFHAPTMEEAQNDPGYAFGLQQGIRAREMSAAARGSLLGGGQQKALTRYANDYATTKYGELFNRSLATRGQQYGEFQSDTNDAFNQYRQRYQQFQDQAQMGLQANQANAGNTLNRYGAMLQGYNAQTGANRTAANDYWQQQQDLQQNQLSALALQRPTGA